MKKIKNTKTNKKQQEVSNKLDLRNILIIFTGILIVFIIFYSLTLLILKKSEKKVEFNNPGIEVKENDIMIHQLLDQKESLYYVLAVNDNYQELYDGYTGELTNLYTINLENAFNKNIIGEEFILAESPRDIKINDTTLFVVENGALKEYYIGHEDVLKYLRELANQKNLNQ